MARGINKVILVGNCGQDPETRYAASGAAITNMSIATSESWKDKQTGQQQERTEWHRVVFFNRLGEIAGEYLRKGAKVYVEGSLRTRKWQDQQGMERYTTEIVASEMQMLDSRSGGEAGGGYGQPAGMAPGMNNPGTSHAQPMHSAPNNNYANTAPAGGNAPGGYQKPANPAPMQQPPQQAPQGAPDMDSFDDDIPF